MKRLEKKHPLAVRWCHWVNFPVLMVMIWSGLLIYWANDVYYLGWGRHVWFPFFPEWIYKRIGTLRFTDLRPADYWAERGYDWYAGH